MVSDTIKKLKNNLQYDVVFWGHGLNDIDRYLPIMIALKNKKIRPLLFYQNYRADDELCFLHKEIIKKFDLEVKDFSSVFDKSTVLMLLSFFVSICRVKLLRNKFRGLRSKVLLRKINRAAMEDFIKMTGHKVNVFDFITINESLNYPYGSFYIKDVSTHLGIKNIAIPHGSFTYIADHMFTDQDKLNFDKIFVSSALHKRSMEENCVDKGVPVLALGDPRYDTNWKKTLNNVLTGTMSYECRKVFKKRLNILYYCPNFEQVGLESYKYSNLEEVSRIVNGIDGGFLIIKPHPRYRNEKLIRKVLSRVGLKDYQILSDDAPLCYNDYLDFVISPSTSAFFDFLPEYHDKIIAYDSFMKRYGIKNIFEGHVKCFNDYKELKKYIESYADKNKKCEKRAEGKPNLEVINFCSEIVAGGGAQDAVVDRYCEHIIKELEVYNEK
jgi:hypothetical protein